jgi:MFS transporter, ACS family, glucarate transporter
VLHCSAFAYPMTTRPSDATPLPLARPSNVRWRILAAVMFMTFLTYLDRLNLSIAGQSIQHEMGFSTETMGWLLSAFLLGYALLQIPGGWLADRFGARDVLFAAVLWWSLFTALTAVAPRLPLARWFTVAWSFAIVRFLVGVGEASSQPSINKIVANWSGSGQRGFGTSFSIAGIGVSGAATPVLIAWIMQRWGWRSSFFVAGAAGVITALVWRFYVTNHPGEHPGVNAEELALLSEESGIEIAPNNRPANTPWKRLLASRSVAGLALGYFCQGFPIYFFHTWFFIYLVNIRHLSITKSSLLGTMPYIAIAALAPLGGLFSDFAVRRLGKRQGRRLAIATGMIASAILLWLGSNTRADFAAILLLAAGAGFNLFAAVSFWAVCIDLTKEFTASVSGLMNTFGNLGGWLSPILTAYLAAHYGWNRALLCASVVTLGAALFAFLIRADESLDRA